MTNFKHIRDDFFFQRNTAEFNYVINQLMAEKTVHPTLSQEITSVKKTGNKLILKLKTKGYLIRKILS